MSEGIFGLEGGFCTLNQDRGIRIQDAIVQVYIIVVLQITSVKINLCGTGVYQYKILSGLKKRLTVHLPTGVQGVENFKNRKVLICSLILVV